MILFFCESKAALGSVRKGLLALLGIVSCVRCWHFIKEPLEIRRADDGKGKSNTFQLFDFLYKISQGDKP